MATKDVRKVVVRILPPEIDEEDLISTFPTGLKPKWSRFHPGKRVKGESKNSINARYYLTFDNVDAGDNFISKYHGHSFIDEKGEAFRAVTSYAPFQKVPKAALLRDKLSGTLEKDSTYQAWLKKRDGEGDDDGNEAKGDDTGEINKEDTPLLQYIRGVVQKRRRDKKKEKGSGKGDGSWASSSWPESTRRKRCHYCGTKRRLDEGEDGRMYCRGCWESWVENDAIMEKKEEQQQEEGEKEEEEYMNCPKNHGVKRFTVQEDKDTWWCSNCRLTVSEGYVMYGCRICDFDLCESCYAYGGSSKSKRNRSDNRETRREARRREKKEKKKRRESRRDESGEKKWKAKDKDGLFDLQDIQEEDEADDGGWSRKDRYRGGDWEWNEADREKERERRRRKKKRRKEEAAAAERERNEKGYSYYRSSRKEDDDYYSSSTREKVERCAECGTKRRLRPADEEDGEIYCEKCCAKWGGSKEKWIKK